MQPTIVSQAAVGVTPWVRVNAFQSAFNVGLGVFLENGSTLTYSVQHTFSSFQEDRYHSVSVSQTTTTITVTDNGADGLGHGLVAGDFVQLRGTGFSNIDGPWTVAAISSPTVYTITSTVSQSATGLGSSQALVARVFPHASLVAQTAKGSGSYGFPVTGIRLSVTAFTSGRAFMEVLQGLR